MKRKILLLVVVLVTIGFQFIDMKLANGRTPDSEPSKPALSVDFLTGAEPLEAPVRTDQFKPSKNAGPPLHVFGGRLQFEVDARMASTRIRTDRYRIRKRPGLRVGVPPPFDFELVQSGDRLLPVERGPILGSHPIWEYVLTPGRVWSEPDEDGWSRAALPFALVEKNANCTHNGLLTFLFGDDGAVSRVAYQIGSETCQYLKFDAWGVAPAVYRSGSSNQAARAVDAYRLESAARLPVKPIKTLSRVYQGVDWRAFGSARDIRPKNMTLFGVVADGVHYVGGCQTRYGPYPYCDELVIPSYSLAKSLFAGLAMMRLEHLYPRAMDALIADYVPECAKARDWKGITFENTLDMATGRYRSTGRGTDENQAEHAHFFDFETHARKLHLACTLYPRRSSPGERWVYHTTDTYLLSVAMQRFLQKREGEGADIYRDLLVEPMWKPLGLSPTIHETRRTYDHVGQPFAGWGLWMQRGDLARLMHFLSSERAEIDGATVLDQAALDAALQRDPADFGFRANDSKLRYNNGFWAMDFRKPARCRAPTWVPFMSGYGGITAALVPNGVGYYYVSDGNEFEWTRPVVETKRIRSFCRKRSSS